MIEAHFLPLGRVDAILLGCDGHWAFVDSGFRADGKMAVKYMRGLGITKLDSYIASHRHRNHVGGAPYIIQQMGVDTVVTADERMRERLIGLASGKAERSAVKGAQYRRLGVGHVFWLGGAKLTRLGPAKLRGCTAGAMAENQNSMILRVQHGQRSMLLTGDAGASILGDIDTALLHCEVLKNPHHNGALGAKALGRIDPDMVVVCNGKPPAASYKKRVAALGAALYTAGLKGDGTVVLRGDGAGWTRSGEGGEKA